MSRIIYHDIYGFMPNSVISHLSHEDKMVLLAGYVSRKPTAAGEFIATVVTLALGEKFIKFVTEKAVEALKSEDKPFTEEEVQDLVKGLFEQFATDSNTLQEFITQYVKETGEVLDEKIHPKENMQQTEVYRDSKGRLRDAKGHFIKEEK